MFKIFTLVLIAATSSSAVASSSPCLDLVFAQEKLLPVSEAALACLDSIKVFADGTEKFCSPDHKTFSKKYSSYLSFKQQREDLLRNADNLSDSDREAMLIELRALELRWKVEGYKDEFNALLFQFGGAVRDCKSAVE